MPMLGRVTWPFDPYLEAIHCNCSTWDDRADIFREKIAAYIRFVIRYIPTYM